MEDGSEFNCMIECASCGKLFKRNINDMEIKSHRDKFGEKCLGTKAIVRSLGFF